MKYIVVSIKDEYLEEVRPELEEWIEEFYIEGEAAVVSPKMAFVRPASSPDAVECS